MTQFFCISACRSKHSGDFLHRKPVAGGNAARPANDYPIFISLPSKHAQIHLAKTSHSQPEPNQIRPGFAQYDLGHLWKNTTESQSGKLVAGWLRSNRNWVWWFFGKAEPNWMWEVRSGTYDPVWFSPWCNCTGWLGIKHHLTYRSDSGCMLAIMAITGCNQNAAGLKLGGFSFVLPFVLFARLLSTPKAHNQNASGLKMGGFSFVLPFVLFARLLSTPKAHNQNASGLKMGVFSFVLPFVWFARLLSTPKAHNQNASGLKLGGFSFVLPFVWFARLLSTPKAHNQNASGLKMGVFSFVLPFVWFARLLSTSKAHNQNASGLKLGGFSFVLPFVLFARLLSTPKAPRCWRPVQTRQRDCGTLRRATVNRCWKVTLTRSSAAPLTTRGTPSSLVGLVCVCVCVCGGGGGDHKWMVEGHAAELFSSALNCDRYSVTVGLCSCVTCDSCAWS